MNIQKQNIFMEQTLSYQNITTCKKLFLFPLWSHVPYNGNHYLNFYHYSIALLGFEHYVNWFILHTSAFVCAWLLLSNIVWKTHQHCFTLWTSFRKCIILYVLKYKPFLLFALFLFYKVAGKTETMNTESFTSKRNSELGSCEPQITLLLINT